MKKLLYGLEALLWCMIAAHLGACCHRLWEHFWLPYVYPEGGIWWHKIAVLAMVTLLAAAVLRLVICSLRRNIKT